MEFSKNKKAFESQKRIYKGLRKILLTKPLCEVTVTDIQKECNISRSTFYRNFNNVVEPLEVMLDYFYKRYLDNKADHNDNQLQFFFDYWINHKDLIYIISHQNVGILKEIIKKYETNTKSEYYMIDLKCSVLCSLLTAWVESPAHETPEEMAKKTRDLLTKFVDLGL